MLSSSAAMTASAASPAAVGQPLTRLHRRRHFPAFSPLITFVTFGELAKWAEIPNWGQRRREELTSWLSALRYCPATRR
jgi:hypothetical protein